MYSFGQEFLNWSQYYKVHGNLHGPFRYRIFELPQWYGLHVLHGNFNVHFWRIIFELMSMLHGSWKFPWTLLDNNF